MNQHDAVIKTMVENGGYATLGYLNQNVFKIKDCIWKTKTPFASIRRIVQNEKYFFKIRPGLWALKSFKSKLSADIYPSTTTPKSKQQEYNHTYYQGLLVEVGNLRKYKTFVPLQDKNKPYLGKRLGMTTSLQSIPKFSYDHIINKAKTVDVIWFNDRNMPTNFFEVEHSTAMQNSLLKFLELQDFNIHFFIVADSVRKNEYESKLSSFSTFAPLRKRMEFLSYQNLFERALKI